MLQHRLRHMRAAAEQRRHSDGLSIPELMMIDDGLLRHILQWMCLTEQAHPAVDGPPPGRGRLHR
jgi:hypothetical protein